MNRHSQLQNTSTVPEDFFDSDRIRRIAERMFEDYNGSLGIRFWDGMSISLGSVNPLATIIVNTARVIRELAWKPDLLRLAEAYISGEIDVEGDLFTLLSQRGHLQSLGLSIGDRLALFYALLIQGARQRSYVGYDANERRSQSAENRLLRKHSKAHNRKAIAFHYDVSNDFYRLWLDDQMVYSCAYFRHPEDSLEHAQCNKLDLVCRKLRLKAGERLLDIGCGWGALICWAVQHYGVQAHGITLSRQQYNYATAKIHALGLTGKATVEFKDYRDLPKVAAFDKIASIGMFEHVGIKNLPTYFRTVQALLKPGGLFLNHGITDNDVDKRSSVGMAFIHRYVFPDGELDNLSNVQQIMEKNGFEVIDVEALRPHYVLTLRHWVRRLEARYKDAVARVSEATYRVWRLYMAASALQFEAGEIGVYQILAVNRLAGLKDLPLTREDIYRWNRNPSTR